MASSASDAPVTKSESAPASDEAPAVASGTASSAASVTAIGASSGTIGAGANDEAPAVASGAASKAASVTAIGASSGTISAGVNDEAPAFASGAASRAANVTAIGASSGTISACASRDLTAAAAAPDGHLVPEAEVGQGAQPDLSNASVTKEEMERYIKISRDLKLRRGSLMPPGGMGGSQSGKNINATTTVPIPLCMGTKKKPSLTMETRLELYGRGRVKFTFDGVSEEPAAAAGGAPQQPVVHQEESATSLVKRGGPSTAITPRRLSLEERAPPPTPAPSLASLHKRCKSQDFGTIPLKDDDLPDPSNPS